MNAMMACDEASEQSESLSALNASLTPFVHKTLKAEQVECIRRIVCHGRDVLAVLPTGFGKSAIYQLIPKVLFNLGRTANAISKTTVAVVSPLDNIRNQQVASIEKMDCGICAAAIGVSIQGDSEIEVESSTIGQYKTRTADYGLGIKHGLGYKTRTKHYGLGIKYFK